MAKHDSNDMERWSRQGGQGKVNPESEDMPGNEVTAGETREGRDEQPNAAGRNMPQGGTSAGRGGNQGGQNERSGGGQKGDEKPGQRQVTSLRGDTSRPEARLDDDDAGYDEGELRPGGSGKQGDQQQFGQEREQRKDKSKDTGGSDKLH